MREILVVLGLCVQAAAGKIFVLQDMREVTPYAQSYGKHVYMNCDDTFISSSAPDANYGGAPELVIEAARVKLLIRFGQLNRAIGVNREVTRAVLVLFPVQGRHLWAGSPVRVSRILVNWGEGSGEGSAGYWAATWNQRFSSSKGNGHAWATTSPSLGGQTTRGIGELRSSDRLGFAGHVLGDRGLGHGVAQ